MTMTAFPGHVTRRLRSRSPLPRWRSLAGIVEMVHR